MSRRLLLDGNDLALLVARIRTEMGPQAKIIKAERVRSGGIGGFFAREHFEVTVEVPDGVPAGGSGGLLETASPAPASAPGGLDALLDAADASDGSGTPPTVVSTDGSAFAAVLDSVRQLAAEQIAGSAPRAPEDGGARAAGPAPDARREDDAVVAVTEPGVQAAPPDTPAREPSVVSGRRGASPAELRAVGVPEPLLESALAAAGGDETQRLTLSQVLARVPRAPRLVTQAGAVVVVAGRGPVAWDAARTLAARLELTDERIALAGDFGGAGGRGPWITSTSAATRLREEAARSGIPLLVSLNVRAGRFGESEASDLVAALAPDQLWVAVEADRALEESERWLTRIGRSRPVDAIAARRVAEAAGPARLLELGVPVGFLDELAASAPVWAALLSERLDDPVWD